MTVADVAGRLAGAHCYAPAPKNRACGSVPAHRASKPRGRGGSKCRVPALAGLQLALGGRVCQASLVISGRAGPPVVDEVAGGYRRLGDVQPPSFPLLGGIGWLVGGQQVVPAERAQPVLPGGYRKHVACVMSGRYSRLPAASRAGVRIAVERFPVSVKGRGLRYARWAKRFLTFAELPEEPRFRRSYTLYDPEELAALVSPELAGHIDRLIEEHSEIYHDNSLQDEVNRRCLADARLFLPGLNLAYTDRASMAASVEVRVPLVDRLVAQAAFSIGGRDKIRRRQGKVALKQAAESWRPRSTSRARGQDKGQRAELARFVEASLTAAAMPIPLEDLIAVTSATIAVHESLSSGRLQRA